MQVLPPRTLLPKTPIRQRHNPRPVDWQGGYRKYGPCLRWDFGFTCAFCLLHEADLVRHGVSGLGIFTAEHFEPQSVSEQAINDYSNLVYACRWCNRARSVAPGTTSSCRLLNPTQDSWAHHFQIEEDNFRSRAGDADALYTCDAYNLNDGRKVALRDIRHKTLSEAIPLVKKGPAALEELTDLAEKHLTQELIEAHKALSAAIRLATLNLESYLATPLDAPTQCRCGTTNMHSLPEEFAEQAVQI